MSSGERPVVLCVVRHYLPGFRSGGPVRSLSRLIEEIGHDFRVHVVCLDRDAASDRAYDDVQPGRWHRVGLADVLYLRPEDKSLPMWRRVLDRIRPDLIYVNSLFDPVYSMRLVFLAAARGIPVVLAPRGELSPGALRLKRFRKHVALAIMRRLPWYPWVHWHASSDDEADEICSHFRTSRDRVTVIPNLPSFGPAREAAWDSKLPGTLRVLFLSRVAPKKNLLGALEMIARAGDGITLDIWGPIEDAEYAATCRSLAARLGLADKVSWCGPIAHAEVRERMACYDLLLFPTFGENFGHVIVEALSAGLPVLISDRTPWKGLRQQGVGVELPLDDSDGFSRELQRFRDMDAAGLASIRRRCLAFATEWARRHPGPDAYRHLWWQALQAGVVRRRPHS